MNSEEAQVAEWLKAQRNNMLHLLRDAVNIDSGSYDKAGVDRVGTLFQDFLRAHDIDTHREPHSEFGDAITAEISERGTNSRPVLLLGHRDTVFPKGDAERRPFTIVDGRGYGPGVCDMKAGLVMNLFVAVALKKFGAGSFPVRVLITSDEEIGSPSSRTIIEREARAARAVFNSEAGRLNDRSQGRAVHTI
jgi:glutamate carboxypeptidase